MKVFITGGGGFIGYRIARAILAGGQLADGEGKPQKVTQVTLFDTAFPPVADARIKCVVGDVSSPAAIEAALDKDTASVFHLAAVVSGGAEADFDLGLTGFTDDELNALMNSLDASTGPQEGEDDVPETPEDPVSRLGDLWVLGNHRLLCGEDIIRQLDSTDRAMLISTARMPAPGSPRPPWLSWTGRLQSIERMSSFLPPVSCQIFAISGVQPRVFPGFIRPWGSACFLKLICVLSISFIPPSSMVMTWGSKIVQPSRLSISRMIS